MHLNNKCIIINLQCTIFSYYKIMHMKESRHVQFEVFSEVLLKDSSLLGYYTVSTGKHLPVDAAQQSEKASQ
jgi:hypothetical protein